VTIFQVGGIVLMASFAALTAFSVATRQLGRTVGLAWLLIWLAAGVAIALPEMTAFVARAVGIARGADLVFYSGIIAMLIGFFATYARLRRLEGAVSTLVRELALRHPEHPEGGEPSPSHRRREDAAQGESEDVVDWRAKAP